MTRDKLGRLPHFDFFRGIAIILVFFVHVFFTIDLNFKEIDYHNNLLDSAQGLRIVMNLLPFGFGETGVHLFLIISGFLIHFGFLNSKDQDVYNWKKFYLRRFWRIYPPYIISLVFFSLIHCSWDVIRMKDILMHVFLIHNYDYDTFYSINGTFWSLALEFQLYLLYPIILFLFRKFGAQKITICSMIVGLLATFYFNFSELRHPCFQNSIPCIGFLWILGAYGAEQYFKGKIIWNISIFWIVLPLIIFYMFLLFAYRILPYVDSLLLGLFWILLIQYFLYKVPEGKVENLLIYKFINLSGITSYGIYLFHAPFLFLLIRWFSESGLTLPFPINRIIASIITYLFMMIFSYGFYELIEKKSIGFGKRMIKK